MRNQEPSHTAAFMAFFRAIETNEPSGRRLFNDPYAQLFLPNTLRRLARVSRFAAAGGIVRAILDLGWPHTRSSGLVRTRAIDDLVREAIRSGIRQLVLLGAGFDSRAYRLEEAKAITVFEVDHPATQRVKHKCLEVLSPAEIDHVHFIGVNFEKDDLEAELIKAGFDANVPTVVVWEGVVSYLTEAAVESNLAVLSRLLAAGSHLILTYMHKGAVDGSAVFPGARRWRSWVKFSGEPFIFGFDPPMLAGTLRTHGFLLRNDESTEQIAKRYCASIGRQEAGAEAYRVASAIRTES